ncbi:MAG TPA: glycosyltransferase family 39 protein [Solirubrobacteraceae bacterium]|nr:glycosyltransferase family 39 protein [Solirubrobacteraceae bacterium]
MATYATKPAWELGARAPVRARIAVPLGLGVLVLLSAYVRTRNAGVGFWIDEGLSVGIAGRPLTDIPGVLRQDGSPPLYYVLVHLWMPLAGDSEAATRALSLLFGLLCVPVAWWGGRLVLGARTGWMAAMLAAANPFVTQYAQETRMYALVALLGLVAVICWLQAFVAAPPAGGGVRVRAAIGVAAAFAAMLYTHNWAAFLGLGTVAALLVVAALAGAAERRRLLRTALVAYGGAAALYLPWLPTLLYQATHTGAPWSNPPDLADLAEVPARLLGETAEIALALAAGAGLVAILARREERRLGAPARMVIALAVIGVACVVAAWLSSQLTPAWAPRYLAAALPPFLLLAAAGLGHAGRLGIAGLVLAVALSAGADRPPREKSNVRDVAEAVAPSLRPGDLVVATQPEQVPVLAYYLPGGVRFATLTGEVRDLGVTDWRDGVERLRRTSAERDLAPLLDALAPGRRLALVQPIVYDLKPWSAPWTELVRLRSEEWGQFVSTDRRFGATKQAPASVFPRRPNPVRATVYLKTG